MSMVYRTFIIKLNTHNTFNKVCYLAKCSYSTLNNFKINLHPLVALGLLKTRGVTKLTELQRDSYISIASGKDVRINAESGSGKTFAYLLPIVNNFYISNDIYENLILNTNVKESLEMLPDEHFISKHQLLGNHLFNKTSNDLIHIDSIQKKDMSNIPAMRSSSRCIVILVPNRDLTSQIIRDLEDLDPIGRLTIQTMVNVDPSHTPIEYTTSDDPLEPKEETHTIKKSGAKDIFYEDQLALMKNIPTTEVESTTIETMSYTHGLRRSKMNSLMKRKYSIQGIKVNKVEYARHTQIISPRIQWGASDIVITTPQLFLNDILHFKNMNFYPSIVIFDEVDMLMENNAHRSNIMQIVSYLRPRPKIYNPILSGSKPKTYQRNPLPPCQFIIVSATINTSGPITCGNMLNERFSTSKQLSTTHVHRINSSLTVKTHEVSDSDNYINALEKVEQYLKPPFRAVVFCESISTVRVASNYFKARGWPQLEYHSGISSSARLANLGAFASYKGSIILIATDLLSRGIDIRFVNIVINLDFPKNSITYLHRLGRTCRLNHHLVSAPLIINLIRPGDRELLKRIEDLHKSGRPLTTIFSRKRSFANRIKSKARPKPKPLVKTTPVQQPFSDGREVQEILLPPLLAEERKRLISEAVIEPPKTEEIVIERLSLRNRRRLLYSNYTNIA